MTILSNNNVRLAVIGLGKMGILHSSILKSIPSVEVVALCEKSGIMRRFLKKVFPDVEIVDDVERLADSKLDAVYITTPIQSHFPIAKTIYVKKIARNMFVEKTLANNYSEAKELCSLADHWGGANMVGYLRRFYVTFRKAKELISQQIIGETASFEAYAYSSDFIGTKRKTSVFTGIGDVLKDLGCYAVDLALWFFGELDVSSLDVKSLVPSYPEDLVNFTIEGFKGLKGKFSISRRMEAYRMPEVGLSILGSKGSMKVNDDKVELVLRGGKSIVWYRHNLNDSVPFWLGLPEYYREDSHFVNSIIEGHSAEPIFFEASKVDEIITQIEQNAGKVNE